MTVSMGYLLNQRLKMFSLQSASFISELASSKLLTLADGPITKNYLRYPRSYYCAQATLYLAAPSSLFAFRF